MKNVVRFFFIFFINQLIGQEIRLFSIDRNSDFLIEKLTTGDLRIVKDTLLKLRFKASEGKNTVLRFIISDSILLSGPERKKEVNEFIVLLVINPNENTVLRSVYYNLDNAEYPNCNVLYSTSLVKFKKNKLRLKKLKLLPFKFLSKDYECLDEEYSKIPKKHLKLSLVWSHSDPPKLARAYCSR